MKRRGFLFGGVAGLLATPAGVLAQSSGNFNDYLLALGLGQVPGKRRIAALGNNADIDTVPADVGFGLGSGLYPWMTGATALEILSASASDTGAGTGARTVLINGLDAAWAEVSQTVTLNGVTPVAIPTSLYRIQSALVMTAGTGEVNAGAITIRDSGGGTTRATIPVGIGITRQSQFTVPAGHTLSVNSMFFSINQPSTIRDASVATYIANDTGAYRLPFELSVDGNPYRHDGLPGIILPEKFDFGLRCTFVSAVNTNLTAAWLGVLSRN